MFSAFILPANTDTQGLEDNKTWMLILSFPGILFIFEIVGFLFFFRNDSPKFYVQRGDYEGAIKAIHQTYKTHDNDYLAE